MPRWARAILFWRKVRAVGRALGLFPNSQRWKGIQKNGMKQDFSWDVSAREYVKVYRGA